MNLVSRTVLLLSVLMLASCSRPAVRTYTAPHEAVAVEPAEPHAMPPHGTMEHSMLAPGMDSAGLPTNHATLAPAAVESAAAIGLAWHAPDTWQAGEATAMRLAAYNLTTEAGPALVAITAINGDAGGELANLNRWRSQVGLPPAAADQLDAIAVPHTLPIGPGRLVDLAGDQGAMVVAMFPNGGRTWFVKLTGAPPAIASARPAFMDFLASIHSTTADTH